MSIFDSDWQRLHKNIFHRYELISLKNRETGFSPGGADMIGIITEIVREKFPDMNQADAIEFVENEYKSFKEFNVFEIIRDALRQRNPAIKDADVLKFLDIARRRFHDPEIENWCFLFFIISKIIEMKHLSISRGAYLIEITFERIPKTSRVIRSFQLWKIFAHEEAMRLKDEADKLKGGQ